MLLRCFVLSSCAALSLFGSSPVAHAYCRTRTSDPKQSQCPGACEVDGAPLRWNTAELNYSLNDRGFPGLREDDLRSIIASSFAAWSDVSCDGRKVYIQFDELASSSFRDSVAEGVTPAENTNIVAHLTAAEWRDRGQSSAAYAITGVWYNKNDGEIVGADMTFNGGMGRFGICPDDGCPAGSGLIDLRNVATHEAGHFLGLAHSDVPESTMWCGAMADETEKRTLSDDDREGLCAIYARASAFRRDAHYHGSGACSLEVAPDEHSASTDLAIFTGAGLLLLLQQRRRRRDAVSLHDDPSARSAD
jgi:hypothetical protein